MCLKYEDCVDFRQIVWDWSPLNNPHLVRAKSHL